MDQYLRELQEELDSELPPELMILMETRELTNQVLDDMTSILSELGNMIDRLKKLGED